MARLDVLEGVQVVEYGDHHAAAVTAYHLGLAGADVVLVEPPEGCALRQHPSLFAFAGRGRRLVTLADHLVQHRPAPDVLLRPAYPTPELEANIARRRVDSDWQRTLLVDFQESDGTQLTELTAQAECGITAFLGRAGAPPRRVGYEMISHSAGMLAAQAVVAALMQRGEGRGQSIRVPMSRAAAAILNNVTTASVAPEQPTHFSQGWSHDPSTGVVAADGAFEILFYGTANVTGWVAFCASIGAETLAIDPRFDTHAKRLDHPADLSRALEPWTRQRPRAELIDLVRAAGGTAMPKHTITQAAAWEQTQANGMIDAHSGLPAAPWVLNGVRAATT